jgi:adenylate kinase
VRVPTGAADLVHERRQPLLAAGRHHDLRPAPGEAQRGLAPDAARRTEHDDHLLLDRFQFHAKVPATPSGALLGSPSNDR